MPPFVGRADALTQLLTVSDGVLNARRGGGGSARVPLVLVTGEAGMGKTSLLQRYAAELADRGVRAVWGTCWEGDQAPALWPWTQIVRTLLDQDNDEDAVTAELAVVVPERVPAGAANTRGADDETGRLRVFDAVGQLLARAAFRRPTAVLLDDLQWSDRSTVDLCGSSWGWRTPGHRSSSERTGRTSYEATWAQRWRHSARSPSRCRWLG